MFTGLVESVGTLRQRSGNKVVVSLGKKWDDLVYGESIAVNGCCLTLEQNLPDGELVFHTLEETLRRTNLGKIPVGAKVNLERAMCAGARLGGHIVQGHIDCCSQVLELKHLPDGDVELLVALEENDFPLVVEKGSVALDGVSLTVVEAEKDFFGVRLIPVTLAETALASRKAGTLINVEFDIIGRYVIRQLEFAAMAKKPSGITMDTLREAGFF
jgi:riboflavin synthase